MRPLSILRIVAQKTQVEREREREKKINEGSRAFYYSTNTIRRIVIRRYFPGVEWRSIQGEVRGGCNVENVMHRGALD